MRRLRRLGDRGASAVEYGLVVAVAAALILGAVLTLGDAVRERLFFTGCTALATAQQDGSADCAP